MSVNAINAADQQPQRKSSPIVPALVAGTVLGGAGYAGGHYFGGTRPDLDKVFAMTDDQFTKSTKDGLEGATDAQKTDLETIKKARKDYAGAGATERTTMQTKAKIYAGRVKSQVPSDASLKTNLESLKTEFAGLSAEITKADGTKATVTEEKVLKELKDAKQAIKDAGDDATAKTTAETRFANAKKDAKAFYSHENIKDKHKALNSARNAYQKAKIEIAKAEIAKEGENDVKKAFNEFNTAKTEYTNAKSTKLTEIKGRKEITDAFESVKKLFAKEGKGKTAWIAAACAAAVGLIGGFILGGSKNDVA